MKKVITTVGMSLWQNAKNKNVPLSNRLEEENYNNRGQWSTDIKKQEEKLNNWAKDNPNACAEIASLIKIQAELKEAIEVHLICTETILSRLCAKCIQDWFEGKENFEIKDPSVINGLQVKNRQRFEREGLSKLINKLETIAQNGYYWEDCVLNITGGYKAVIPFLTIMGQVNEIPIYYIFEETEQESYELIQIPNVPIDFKQEIFETHWKGFKLLDKDELVENEKLSSAFLDKCSSCIVIVDTFCELNALGKILWNKYNKGIFSFYSTKEIFSEIQKQSDIIRILQTKFWNDDIRENKTEIKQDHYVFDDGNNNNRIYYFESEGDLYIYKTFESEEKAKAYISTPFKDNQRQSFLKISEEFKIKKII